MTVAARPFGYVGSQPRLRTWLQIGFWIVSGIILLTLTGAQFGPAATISILAITITKATPITLGALAGICSERTGVVNIGIEGLMLTSAFTGFMAGVYLIPEQDIAGETRGFGAHLAAIVHEEDGVRVALDPVALAAIDLDFFHAGTRRDAFAEDASRDAALERRQQQAQARGVGLGQAGARVVDERHLPARRRAREIDLVG